jgi:hypothetical protein
MVFQERGDIIPYVISKYLFHCILFYPIYDRINSIHSKIAHPLADV